MRQTESIWVEWGWQRAGCTERRVHSQGSAGREGSQEDEAEVQDIDLCAQNPNYMKARLEIGSHSVSITWLSRRLDEKCPEHPLWGSSLPGVVDKVIWHEVCWSVGGEAQKVMWEEGVKWPLPGDAHVLDRQKQLVQEKWKNTGDIWFKGGKTAVYTNTAMVVASCCVNVALLHYSFAGPITFFSCLVLFHL